MDAEKYQQCLKEMFSLRRFGIKLGLESISIILDKLGSPHKRFKSIHIAGTNGKGSVASTLASILQAAGYRTGLYTSPHLIRFNERIQINGEEIPDEHVVELHERVKAIKKPERELTFFEYTTAMAFDEFAREKVDWAVIETGMGGRLDATNILMPCLSVITNISLEHCEYLGNTIGEIASEKAGIIKEKRPVVTGVEQDEAYKVIRDIAEKRSAPLYHLGAEFNVREGKNSVFDYLGMEHSWKNMRPTLLGRHQIQNAALVLAACEVLEKEGQAEISEKALRDGMSQVKWPGRLEVVSKSPLVIIDGAHNMMSIQRLTEFLTQEIIKSYPLTLVMGILNDKPYQSMFKSLLPLAKRLILTRPKIERGLPAEELQAFASNFLSDITVIPDVGKALRYAIENADKSDAICVCGSLYVIGEAKAELANMRDSLFLA